MPFTGFRSGARVHTRDPHEAWHERTSSHSAWASLLVLLPAVVVLSDNEVWSLYGAPWLQPVATRRKSQRLRSRRNTRKPLPYVATVCRSQRMVRRGSTVRVRQRALQKSRITGLLLSVPLAQSSACGRYGALYGAFRSKTAPGEPRRPTARRPTARSQVHSGGAICTH
jgi:hypothetical protein